MMLELFLNFMHLMHFSFVLFGRLNFSTFGMMMGFTAFFHQRCWHCGHGFTTHSHWGTHRSISCHSRSHTHRATSRCQCIHDATVHHVFHGLVAMLFFVMFLLGNVTTFFKLENNCRFISHHFGHLAKTASAFHCFCHGLFPFKLV